MFNCNMTVEIQNACPSIVISKFLISPVGRTELVSTIRNQNGHDSHSWIPSVSHVLLMITFTPDPPSTIVPVTSLPLLINVTIRLLVSTTVGPSLGFVKNVDAFAGFDGASVDFRLSANRGSNCSSLCKGMEIWQLVRACHTRSSLSALVGWEEKGGPIVISFISVCILSVLAWLAVSTHFLAVCRTSSWISHCVLSALLRVMTYSTSAIMMFMASALPRWFSGH